MVVDRPACCGFCHRGVPPDIPVATQITQFPPSAGAVENAEGEGAPGPFQLVRRSGRVIDSSSGADCSGESAPAIHCQGNRRLCRNDGPRQLKFHTSSTHLSLVLPCALESGECHTCITVL